jgi:hypothetical protein
VAYAGLELVTGNLVHNAGSVVTDGVDPVKYEGGRMQYAFRNEAGDMLLVDKSKMGVALFDIYTEEVVPEGGSRSTEPTST